MAAYRRRHIYNLRQTDMTHYSGCPICYKNIAQVNEDAAKLWRTLTKKYSENLYFFSAGGEMQELYDLETRGFVVSYEGEERIFFILNGLHENTFCLQPELHKERVEEDTLSDDELGSYLNEF